MAKGVLLLAFLLLVGATAAPTAHATNLSPPCAEAKVLTLLERYGAAETALLENLKAEPGLPCARVRLRRLARFECDRAKALVGAGQKGMAEEAFEKVLEADPESTCAETELKELTGKTRFEEAKELGEKIAKWAALVVIALLVAVIPLLLFLRFLVLWSRSRHWWLLQKLLRLSVLVAAFDTGWMDPGMAPQFTSLFRAGFQPGPSHSLTTATGHTEIDEILNPLGEISAAKTPVAVASFLISILPRLSYGINGSLQPKGSRRQGVTIELTRGKHGVAVGTLWGADYETAVTPEGKANGGTGTKAPDPSAPGGDIDVFQQMAVPAAAWAEYQLANDLGDTSNLRTSNAISWAFFRAGSDCQRREENMKAAALYQKALDSDPANAGALANLGLILWTEEKTDEAEVLLNKALREYENGKGISFETNPDWYRAKFNLAGLHANLGAKAPAGAAEKRVQFGEARAAAKKIIELGLREMLRRPHKKINAGALKAIENVVMASFAVYAATSAEVQPSPPGPS